MRAKCIGASFLILAEVMPAFGQEKFGYGHVYSSQSNLASASLLSYDKAKKLSILHTIIPFGAGYLMAKYSDNEQWHTAGGILIGYGLLIGPSAGHFYAKDLGRAAGGVGIRFLSTAGVYFSFLLFIGELFDYGSSNSSGAEIAFIAGVLTYAVGTAYSFATLRKSVEEYNRSASGRVRVQLAPSYDIGSGTPLLSARIRF